MAAKHKVTVSRRAKQWQSAAERRAAQVEALSGKQAQLKQEAAERRLTRGASKDTSTASPRNRAPRRSSAR